MSSSVVITRRAFLGRVSVGLAVIGVSSTLGACGGEEPVVCGATGLTSQEQTMRTQVGYVDPSPEPAKACSGCQLYTAPAGGAACGTCALNLGAVGPGATCRSFVARS